MRQAIQPLQWSEAFRRKFASYTDSELTLALRNHHPDGHMWQRIMCELWARDNGLSVVRVVPQVPTFKAYGEPLRKIR